jgi:putative tryptophan/tyrosine transport system substrate-binding protein
MVRNAIFLLFFALVLASSHVAAAQQHKTMARIGLLNTRPAARDNAIRRELHRLGWIEGQNIVFERRYTEGNLDRLPALSDELVRLKVDVIFTGTTPATRAAKKATKTIPVVFLTSGDPVMSGVVDSLARPGGNLTGFTAISPVIAGKRLELLKETVPKLSSVAVLWAPGQNELSWKESQLAGRQLGLQIHSMEISDPDQFSRAFEEALKAGSGALAVTPSSINNSNRKLIAELAVKIRLPAIYPDIRGADAGGLMSYGVDPSEPVRRIAIILDKILKGAKPADIPVEQPTKFELVINLKTAKQIVLTIPPNLLVRANRVIR